MNNYDLYGILGISSTASYDEIKRAYRSLVMKYHPDINPTATDEQMKLVNIAYDILSDPVKRQKYDLMQKYGVQSNVYSANYGDTVEFTSLREFFEFLSNLEEDELRRVMDQLYDQLFSNFINNLRKMGERFVKGIENTVKGLERGVRSFLDLLPFRLFRRDRE